MRLRQKAVTSVSAASYNSKLLRSGRPLLRPMGCGSQGWSTPPRSNLGRQAVFWHFVPFWWVVVGLLVGCAATRLNSAHLCAPTLTANLAGLPCPSVRSAFASGDSCCVPKGKLRNAQVLCCHCSNQGCEPTPPVAAATTLVIGASGLRSATLDKQLR